MTDEQTILAALGGAAMLGGLGYSLYNKVKGMNEINAASAALSRYNNELKRLGLTVSDKELRDAIKKEIGASAPIAVVIDKKKAKELGVIDNAFYTTPGYFNKEELKELGVKGPVDKTGVIVMSDNKAGSLPILAHELGHAKDYEEGNLSKPWVTNLIRFGGLGLGIAGGILAPRYLRFNNPYTALLTNVAATMLPIGLSSWWANRRTLGDERRASDKAKVALKAVGERLGKAYELRKSEKLLDKALSTYEIAANREARGHVAAAVRLPGLGTLAASLA